MNSASPDLRDFLPDVTVSKHGRVYGKKPSTKTIYRGVLHDSKIEAVWHAFFDAFAQPVISQPSDPVCARCRYRPDFLLESHPAGYDPYWVEVKYDDKLTDSELKVLRKLCQESGRFGFSLCSPYKVRAQRRFNTAVGVSVSRSGRVGKTYLQPFVRSDGEIPSYGVTLTSVKPSLPYEQIRAIERAIDHATSIQDYQTADAPLLSRDIRKPVRQRISRIRRQRNV